MICRNEKVNDEILKVLGSENSHRISEVNTYGKFRALEILGSDKLDIALKIGGQINSKVPDICLLDRAPWIFLTARNVEMIQLHEERIYQALDILKSSNNVHLALRFTTDDKVRALSILGPEKAELALKMANRITNEKSIWHDGIYKALEILRCEEDTFIPCSAIPNISFFYSVFYKLFDQSCNIIELAPLFKFYNLRVLEILGCDKALLSLEIGEKISDTTNLDDPFWKTQLREKHIHNALEILKDSPNVKHALHFTDNNSLASLNNCNKNEDCRASCFFNEQTKEDYNKFLECYEGFFLVAHNHISPSLEEL